jgi:hypothetical protein
MTADRQDSFGRTADDWPQRLPLGIGWIIAIVGAPLAFLSKYGIAWLLFVSFLGAALWWWKYVYSARAVRRFSGPGERTYSWCSITGYAVLPAGLFAAFLIVMLVSISDLDLWRSDYDTDTVATTAHGTVTKFFGDQSAPRTTPDERDRFDRNEWIRWLEAGAKKQSQGGELLFIKTKEFEKQFRTLIVEVHVLGNQVTPVKGSAFLVHDPQRRPVYREVRCEFAADRQSRLFRITVENPNADEALWMFLAVVPASGVVINNLTPQLRVPP